jgi:hypothetical protein
MTTKKIVKKNIEKESTRKGNQSFRRDEERLWMMKKGFG